MDKIISKPLSKNEHEIPKNHSRSSQITITIVDDVQEGAESNEDKPKKTKILNKLSGLVTGSFMDLIIDESKNYSVDESKPPEKSTSARSSTVVPFKCKKDEKDEAKRPSISHDTRMKIASAKPMGACGIGRHEFRKRVSNRITMTFKESFLEMEYKTFRFKQQIRSWRIFLVLFLITDSLAFIIRIIMTETSVVTENLVYNYRIEVALYISSILIPTVFILGISLIQKIAVKYMEYLSSLMIVAFGTTVYFLDYVNPKLKPGRLMIELVLFLFASHVFLHVRFIHSIVHIILYAALSAAMIMRTYDTVFNDYLAGSAFLLISFIIILSAVFGAEKNTRCNFLDKVQIEDENRGLRMAVVRAVNSAGGATVRNSGAGSQNLKNNYDYLYKIDFDSPLSKATEILRSILQLKTVHAAQKDAIIQVLEYLSTSNVNSPNIEKQLYATQMDKYTKPRPFLRPSAMENTSKPSINLKEASYWINDLHGLLTFDISNPELEELLWEATYSWSFSIFKLDSLTSGNALVVLAHYLFWKEDLYGSFNIHPLKFIKYALSLQSGYRANNPYHNHIHAADVLQGTYFISQQQGLSNQLSKFDKLKLYFSAIIHDFQHPGFTNSFLIQIRDIKALIYNDQSVLENHHVAAAFQLLEGSENCFRSDGTLNISKIQQSQSKDNFLSNLTKELYSEFREDVIDLVLSTDIANHINLLSNFNRILKRNSCQKVTNLSNIMADSSKRINILQLILKCSDVNNPARKTEHYLQWTSLILKEWFKQGEIESKLGMPLSPYMDYKDCDIGKCQITFIEYIIMPLFQTLDDIVEIPELIQQIQNNLNHWYDAENTSAFAKNYLRIKK